MKNKVMYIFKLSLTGAVIFTAFISVGLCNFGLLMSPVTTVLKVFLFIATPIFLLLCIYNTVVMQKEERENTKRNYLAKDIGEKKTNEKN